MNNSTPDKQIQHFATKRSSAERRGVQHGFGFNHQATEFVPGSGRQGQQRQSNKDGKSPVTRHKGEHSPKAKEGGLSQALRSNGNSEVFEQSQNGPVLPSTMSRMPESSPLGKSPSRTFVSANHLLNFQFDRALGRSGGPQGRARGGRRGGARQQPYDRNKFLQANFRFLVSDAADLRSHHSDADLMLDWGDVLEVEMLVPAPIRCPISLDSPPLCPQITPCGHAFSFPAIMAHLLNHGGDALRKASPCPLCNAAVVARELRLVRAIVAAPLKVGDLMVFKLLKRDRHDINAEEVKPAIAEAQKLVPGDTAITSLRPWHATEGTQEQNGRTSASILDTLGYNRFAKFTQVANAPLLWEQAAAQLAAYAAEVTADGGPDAAQEAPFIYAAMDALANRSASWAERRQRLLQEQEADGANAISPHDAAIAAAAAVKRVTNATVFSAAEQKKRDAEELARLVDFPSLAGNQRPLVPHPRCSPSGAMSHAAASKAQGFEAAFSDDGSPHAPDPPSASAAVETGVEQQADLEAGRTEAVVPQENCGRPEPGGNAPGTSPGHSRGIPPPQPPANEYYFYQSEDGQWVFLHPLLTRVLLAHYGSYEALPSSVHGPLLELEPQVQTETLRKRHKYLGHLPLCGAYALAEIDLRGVLPESALAPFSKDLAARQVRRETRAAEEQCQAARDAARAEAQHKASLGPSIAELKDSEIEICLQVPPPPAATSSERVVLLVEAMPLPGGAFHTGRSESNDLQEAMALSLVDSKDREPFDLGSSPPPAPPQSGVSFAHMAKMGFAASGPALSSTPPSAPPPAWGPRSNSNTPEPASQPFGSYPPSEPAAGVPNWGGAQQGSLATRLAEAEAAREKAAKEGPKEAAQGKSKKHGRQLVVLGMQNRRY